MLYCSLVATLEQGVGIYLLIKSNVALERCVLALMRDNPGQFLVSIYGMDLVWPVHILGDTAGYAPVGFRREVHKHKEEDDRREGVELQTRFSQAVTF